MIACAEPVPCVRLRRSHAPTLPQAAPALAGQYSTSGRLEAWLPAAANCPASTGAPSAVAHAAADGAPSSAVSAVAVAMTRPARMMLPRRRPTAVTESRGPLTCPPAHDADTPADEPPVQQRDRCPARRRRRPPAAPQPPDQQARRPKAEQRSASSANRCGPFGPSPRPRRQATRHRTRPRPDPQTDPRVSPQVVLPAARHRAARQPTRTAAGPGP